MTIKKKKKKNLTLFRRQFFRPFSHISGEFEQSFRVLLREKIPSILFDEFDLLGNCLGLDGKIINRKYLLAPIFQKLDDISFYRFVCNFFPFEGLNNYSEPRKRFIDVVINREKCIQCRLTIIRNHFLNYNEPPANSVINSRLTPQVAYLIHFDGFLIEGYRIGSS